MENNFKKNSKQAACTSRPWEYLIPKDLKNEVIQKVNSECLTIYGKKFNECSKRLVCFKKTCLGRELEWNSSTARPYLEQFAQLNNIPIGGEYFIKTNCNNCPIYDNCKTSCKQIDDYNNRERIEEPYLEFRNDINNLMNNVQLFDNSVNNSINFGKIPWDCISEKRQFTIKKYLYEQKDFYTIAKELNYSDQATAKSEMYSALNVLAKTAIIRKFIEDKGFTLNEDTRKLLIEVYVNNKTITQVATELNISQPALSKLIKATLKEYKIKWPVFIRKKKNKVTYNTNNMLK